MASKSDDGKLLHLELYAQFARLAKVVNEQEAVEKAKRYVDFVTFTGGLFGKRSCIECMNALARIYGRHRWDDVLEELHLALYTAPNAVDHPERLFGWLRTAAARIAIHLHEREKQFPQETERDEERESLDLAADMTSIEEDLVSEARFEDLRRAVASAVAKLPPAQKDIASRVLTEQSNESIAAALNTTCGNVRQRWFQARRRLVRILATYKPRA